MSQVERGTFFPRLSGSSLSGHDLELPDDLEGDINLVFVAFQRRHQDDVDMWIHELGDAERRLEGLAIYEIPLLARYPKFYRRWIDNGMRSGIRDPKTRSRTITVYTDRQQFFESVGLPNDAQILVALLDDTGRMVWSRVGPVTRDAIEDLTTTMTRLRS